jgi:ribA/ribD-fused uncharacterized protein
MASHSPVLFYSADDIYSQWYPVNFTIQGRKFNCAEQWMMYSKAVLFRDQKAADAIMDTKLPRVQKALGRKVRGFDQARWDRYAKEIVYQGNWAKFSQNPDLQDQFLATEGPLGEASPYDAVWGIGLARDDPLIKDQRNWGHNFLGQILTLLRDHMKADPNYRLNPSDSVRTLKMPTALKLM